MRRFIGLAAFLAVGTLAALPAIAADKKLPKQAAKLLAMSPGDWQGQTRIQDDALETSARFDTQLGFQEKHGLLGIVWNDVFLRGYVNKKTGETSYQLYFATMTSASSWPFFNTLNYETPSGPEAGVVKKVGSNVDCSGSRYGGGCTYFEDLIFEPDRELLDKVAATYVPGAVAAWKMRLKGQSGLTLDTFMTQAEVVGFLAAIDAYKVQKGLKP